MRALPIALLVVLVLPAAASDDDAPLVVDPARDFVISPMGPIFSTVVPEMDVTAIYVREGPDADVLEIAIADLAHESPRAWAYEHTFSYVHDEVNGFVHVTRYANGWSDGWHTIACPQMGTTQGCVSGFPAEIDGDRIRAVLPGGFLGGVDRSVLTALMIHDDGTGGYYTVSARDFAPDEATSIVVPWVDTPLGWYAPPEMDVEGV